MREQTLQMLFHVVFLSQVLLVSFYLPRKILGLVQHVVEKYPPSRYPKLYPVSLDVAAACSGFLYALQATHGLMLSGGYRRAICCACTAATCA